MESSFESWNVKAWLETDVLEPARSDGGDVGSGRGQFLVSCQGQLWQLELLGSFWAAPTDQLLGTIKAMGNHLSSPSLVIVWSPASSQTPPIWSYLDILVMLQFGEKCDKVILSRERIGAKKSLR